MCLKPFVPVARLTLAALAFFGIAGPIADAQPALPPSSVIYCVNPEIFSHDGLRGVTAQLPRLRHLGVSVVWLMPIFPRGQACTIDGIAHPAYDSPYCVENMTAIAPDMGTAADLTRLVTSAHRDGMKVILDVALNQTSWDNPLVTRRPQMFRHTDGNPDNVASIADGWGMDRDIAMLDCTTNRYGTQDYLTGVCKYWLETYRLDGFRFDSADNPGGPARSLPQSFMQSLRTNLRAIDPYVIMLGEENDAALALSPYNLDYDWMLHDALARAHARPVNGAPALREAWDRETVGWPAGMRHMLVTQDWDMDLDMAQYGGPKQTLDAMLFNFTMPGVPLIYNGEEAGNSVGGNNTHTMIDWHGPNAGQFERFTASVAALRRECPALTGSTVSWLTAPAGDGQVLLYERSAGRQTVLVEINFGSEAASGPIPRPLPGRWSETTPPAAPIGRNHPAPSTGRFTLAPYDFAVFMVTVQSP